MRWEGCSASRSGPTTAEGTKASSPGPRTKAESVRIGVEGSQHFGAALTRFLLAAGEDVREVPAPLTHRERGRRPSQGKSDPVDAVAIARIVAREEHLSSAHRNALLQDMRLLVDYRDQLVRTRTRIANRAHAELVVARPGYEHRVANLRGRCHITAARTLLRGDRSVRAELLRRHLGELLRLDAEIARAEKQIADKVKESGTTLTEIPGVGSYLAAKIMGEVGDPSRVRSKAAFASLTGTAPVPASSGMTNRHRLNRRGNRQLNWALHFIALAQWRTTPRAREYISRQREAGKSHKEAMRCLKRHLLERRVPADRGRCQEDGAGRLTT